MITFLRNVMPNHKDPGVSQDVSNVPAADDAFDTTGAFAGAQPADEMSAWDEALAQESASAAAEPTANAQDLFRSFDAPTASAASKPTVDISVLRDIPVGLSVELGRTQLTIKDLLQLSQGSVVGLRNPAGGPLDIFINGYLFAQGEVVVIDGNYGVRLTDIVTPSERLSRL